MHELIAPSLRRLTIVLSVLLVAAVASLGDGSAAHAAPTSGFLLATPVSGSGTVSRSPAAAVFAPGVIVTLTSAANPGWRFDHWELDGSGSDNPLPIFMSGNRDVRAVFVPDRVEVVADRYSLTVEVAGDCCGSVMVNSTSSRGGKFDFAPGDDVSLTASVSGQNLRFSHWEADVPGSNVTTIVRMDRDVTVRAVFNIVAPPVVTLRTLGSGVVWSDAEVLAPRIDDLIYEPGTELTLRAIAFDGWRFDHWMGDVTNIDSTIIVTVDQDQSLYAVFVPTAPDLFALAAAASGSGQVLREPAQASYQAGDSVVMTATSADGWKFSHWDGDLFGTDPVVEVTVQRNLSARAIFIVVPRLLLSTSVDGGGSISLTESADGYASGTVVTLVAVPGNSWSFDHWELDAAGNSAVTTVTMDEHRVVRAVFEYTPVTLVRVTTSTVGSGAVTRSPASDSLPTGSTITLTASPALGWRFGHWEGDVAGVFSNVVLTVTDATNAVAVFEPLEGFRLSTEVSGGGSVLSNPTRNIHVAGGLVALTTQPVNGWRFDRWEGDVSGVNTDVADTSVTMTSDKVVRAVFVREGTPATMGGSVPGTSTGGNAAQVPPPGGLTIVTAGTTEIQSFIDSQQFEVSALFVFDLETQTFRTYIVGAPAFAQTLTTLNPTDLVNIRRR